MSDHMIPNLDMDSFLEHHGVKGMKWGKRKGGGSWKNPELKAARKEILKGAGKGTWSKGRKGYTVASALLGTPGISARVGYELSKSAGYGKGKSLAIGLIGGAPGGLIAAEISARKSVRS